jgi:uncharacterized membrane protein YheB (UPF0754 family)
MKLNFEVEINSEEIIQSVEGGYRFTEAVKNRCTNDIVDQICSRLDIKGYSDEMSTNFAKNVYEKIGTLATTKVEQYLSDKSITERVEKNIKSKVDSWIENNLNKYFTEMRDNFIFMRKEDYEAELTNNNK